MARGPGKQQPTFDAKLKVQGSLFCLRSQNSVVLPRETGGLETCLFEPLLAQKQLD